MRLVPSEASRPRTSRPEIHPSREAILLRPPLRLGPQPLRPPARVRHRRGVSAGGRRSARVPARAVDHGGLAALTETVRRRVVRWFRFRGLLDAAAAADMLAWESTGIIHGGRSSFLISRPVER